MPKVCSESLQSAVNNYSKQRRVGRKKQISRGLYEFSIDAQIFGLTDPRLCYILDGLLFIYAVIVTALFFREKELNPRDQGKYDVLNVRGEEKATRRQGLQRDKMSDPYSDIRTKQPQKRQVKKNDPVYQGLNSGSRDTYDALHMQPLPPLP
ncbi:hypothetical protein XELAEV_18011326mg [Xenopus laevis]|uniref:T-cell surface glycoprotein CD3 zeta chain n=1 Tax=Xenopus laevis TaxID=8355 RepID=A0A974DMU9_XENLA|nr:hypothetical protein XELAEV_18011326mg [Xenopus laevis]